MEFNVEQLMATVTELVSTYGFKIVGAIIILMVGKVITGWLTGMVTKALEKSDTDKTLVKFLTSIARVLLRIFVYLAALNMLGIQTASFVAILAAGGLAVGMALQGTLGNFASGVMIILFRPFKIGDFVEAGGAAGVIDEIGIFNTSINTPDNKLIIVPNASITGGNIVNYAAHDTRRVDMVIGIGYGDDIKKAKDLLMDILSSHDQILADPAPVVAMGELADSSVNFNVRPWCATADYWAVYSDVLESVKTRFDQEGISIPYPQQDVHVHQVA